MSNPREFSPRQESQDAYENDLVHGDVPPSDVPGEIGIGLGFPSPTRLKKDVEEFMENNPGLLKFAKTRGKDLIGAVRSKNVILIGAGIAGLVTAGAVGYMIIYKHKKRKLEAPQIEVET